MSIIAYADLRPAYYDDFHCFAAGCRFSCCIGWRISFNKRDYLSLKRQSGSEDLNSRMDNSLHRIRKGSHLEVEYGEFSMKNAVCPLLREDCLCALQLEKGHNALPHVCRSFPRSESYQPLCYLERSLTPACEAVLDLLWNLPDGVEFRSNPLPNAMEVAITFENNLISHFQKIRSLCIDMLQDRRYPLAQRILLIGLSLKELADGEMDIERWIERTRVLSEQNEQPLVDLAKPGSKALGMFLSNNCRTLHALRNTNPLLSGIPKELLQKMGVDIRPESIQTNMSATTYLAARDKFQEFFRGKEYFWENLMVSLFFHLHLPSLASLDDLWKSYVGFCDLYSVYRFLSVMSCRDGVSDNKEELFRLLVYASRCLIHNHANQATLRDEFFQHNSATLAHMAILLSG